MDFEHMIPIISRIKIGNGFAFNIGTFNTKYFTKSIVHPYNIPIYIS